VLKQASCSEIEHHQPRFNVYKAVASKPSRFDDGTYSVYVLILTKLPPFDPSATRLWASTKTSMNWPMRPWKELYRSWKRLSSLTDCPRASVD
jgi:hypothetical protein